MPKRKYAIHPGNIKGWSDNDVHFITFTQLIRLYKVNPNECILWDLNRPETYICRNYSDYIHLYPRVDGNYDLS